MTLRYNKKLKNLIIDALSKKRISYIFDANWPRMFYFKGRNHVSKKMLQRAWNLRLTNSLFQIIFYLPSSIRCANSSSIVLNCKEALTSTLLIVRSWEVHILLLGLKCSSLYNIQKSSCTYGERYIARKWANLKYCRRKWLYNWSSK